MIGTWKNYVQKKEKSIQFYSNFDNDCEMYDKIRK